MVSTFFRDQHVKGSSRTLADLGLDAAGEEGESLRELLASLPERHRPEKAALRRRQHEQFGRWRAQLRAGNSLLLYGFGSKFELLSRFAREQARDGACLAVNGLQPGLTVRQASAPNPSACCRGGLHAHVAASTAQLACPASLVLHTLLAA
jgi:hypothetical protein